MVLINRSPHLSQDLRFVTSALKIVPKWTSRRYRFWIAPSRRLLGVMSSYFTSRRACAWIFMKIMFWLTIRMISTDFDVVSDDLPDVTDVTSHQHKKNTSSIQNHIITKNHHQSRFFTFAPETFPGWWETRVSRSLEHHQPARVWTVPEALCGRWDIRYPVRTGTGYPSARGAETSWKSQWNVKGTNYKFIMLQSMRNIIIYYTWM